MSDMKVRFLKGTNELEMRQAENYSGTPLDYPYIYKDEQGESYLRIGKSRYYWQRGDVGGSFPDVAQLKRYMDRINAACGEIVVVPAEQGGAYAEE